jgi:hypothetical protein
VDRLMRLTRQVSGLWAKALSLSASKTIGTGVFTLRCEFHDARRLSQSRSERRRLLQRALIPRPPHN